MLTGGPRHDMERNGRRKDGRDHGKRRGHDLVGDGDWQHVGEHADEVHRPDADAHHDGTRRQPGIDLAALRRSAIAT